MTSFSLPADYRRIRRVCSFEELVAARFADGVNALCWEREVPDGFAEVARHFAGRCGINTLEEEELAALPLSAGGRVAVEFMLADQRRLRECGVEPVLDYIDGYLRDATDCPVPTDVFSWHADSANTEADTWLCTYLGSPSEGLRDDEAVRRVDVTETRVALLALHGGRDDEAFREHLNEHCFDLHYVPVPGARPFSFGVGNLWRIATEHPGCPVPPCIHRAPETPPGAPPRLLLIG